MDYDRIFIMQKTVDWPLLRYGEVPRLKLYEHLKV